MLPNTTPRINRLQNRSPIRQTVLSGPKSLGLPDFLAVGTGLEVVTAGLTVEPLYFTIGRGYRNGFQDDLLMALESNLAVSLPDNEDRIFLYLEVDLSGDVTLNYTLLDIDLNLDKPSIPAVGQFNYPFDHSLQGSYWNGSTWQNTLRLFVGECTTSGGVVTNIEHYNYNRNVATQIIDLTGRGSFTGGVLLVSRVKNRATTTLIESLTYASSTIASANILPQYLHPLGSVRNITDIVTNALLRIGIDSSGTIFVTRLDSSLNAISTTSSGGGFSISYLTRL